jgi:hypothetical protein
MPSTFSTTLRLELPGNGEQSGIWGQTLNKDLNLVEQSIAGISDIYLTGGTYTLSSFNGLEDESRNAILSCTGILSADANVVAPSVQKTYIITNNAGANVTIKTSTGNGVSVLNGTSALVYCDGTDFYQAVSLNNVIGNQTIAGNEVIGANVTATGNLTVTSNVSSYNGNLTFTSNTSIVTLAANTGAYIPPTGTTLERPASPRGGMSRWNSDIGVYEIFNGAIWQPITGSYTVNYLLVAGGGGSRTGGGGGGGMLSNTSSVSPGIAYTVTVGAGGSSSNGGNSSAFSDTAIGGGAGAAFNVAGGDGGSGGGGWSGISESQPPGNGTSGQGYRGGFGYFTFPDSYGAGGGGAGGVGYGEQYGTSGGIGLQSSITGTAVYYAGGGVGTSGGTPGTGAIGHGGNGGGSSGSAGAVIISYQSATQRATGGTVTSYTSGSQVYWVHTFTSSGTFTA